MTCNWLSRSDFETAIVDHTGIDIIAYDKSTGKRLGISVKSRTRNEGAEGSYVKTLEKENSRELLLDACRFFGAEPQIAIYVESSNEGDLYLTSLQNFETKYKRWRMTPEAREEYGKDHDVRHMKIRFSGEHWWKGDTVGADGTIGSPKAQDLGISW